MDNICVLCIWNRVSISKESSLPFFSKGHFSLYIYQQYQIYDLFILSTQLYKTFKKTIVTFLYFRYHLSYDHMGDILCALIIRIALDQISHTWFDWNLVKGCSLLEENSMDKLKATTIFHSLCAKYSSPWKK